MAHRLSKRPCFPTISVPKQQTDRYSMPSITERLSIAIGEPGDLSSFALESRFLVEIVLCRRTAKPIGRNCLQQLEQETRPRFSLKQSGKLACQIRLVKLHNLNAFGCGKKYGLCRND